MASYERYTAALPAEVFRRAEEVLTARLPLQKTGQTQHSITFAGGDGSVSIAVHRHGPDSQVVATTDQLRTSRLDNDVQFMMTQLPYQPNDAMPADPRP